MIVLVLLQGVILSLIAITTHLEMFAVILTGTYCIIDGGLFWAHRKKHIFERVPNRITIYVAQFVVLVVIGLLYRTLR